ncbi:MAG TPA: hypothetical protein VNO21_00100, partial [Polyangiaceae bacterium]|nr:hypothetical protein [Polyangiaceae bacterium]
MEDRRGLAQMFEKERVGSVVRSGLFVSAGRLVLAAAGALSLAASVLGTAGCAHPGPTAPPVAPPAARAPSEADLENARTLFSDAVNDEEAQDWAGAREKLRQAGAVKMTASIRFHLALCEEQLKFPCEALNDYIGAVNQARDNDDSEVLIASIEGLSRLGTRLSVLKTFSP